MIRCLSTLLVLLLLGTAINGQNLKTIQLPKPDTTGGKPLMQALKERHTSREFGSDTLSLPVLSNLLWAACGVNRASEGKRTAPSAMNSQEIDVYVLDAHGAYRYDSKTHSLQQILAEDIREKSGMQPFVKDAPINLVYVADYSKIAKMAETDKVLYSAADAAFISENVYLFCASEGLATVVRGSVDRTVLGQAMKLPSEQKIILAQTVGHPKK